MGRIRRSLTSGSLAACGRPGLVTVARSAMDPYTPPERACWLQAQVIELVTEVYGAVEVELDLEYEEEERGSGEGPKRGTGPEAQPQGESKRPRPMVAMPFAREAPVRAEAPGGSGEPVPRSGDGAHPQCAPGTPSSSKARV